MATARNTSEPKKPRRPPATSISAKENRMINLAVDLAERQLTDGTASAQVITHYLKLGSTREQLDQEKVRQEIDLLSARRESMASGERVEELYTEAIKAMRRYSGNEEEIDES
jgi:hypothetical protein